MFPKVAMTMIRSRTLLTLIANNCTQIRFLLVSARIELKVLSGKNVSHYNDYRKKFNAISKISTLAQLGMQINL